MASTVRADDPIQPWTRFLIAGINRFSPLPLRDAMTSSKNNDEGHRRDIAESVRDLFSQSGLRRIRIMGVNALGTLGFPS